MGCKNNEKERTEKLVKSCFQDNTNEKLSLFLSSDLLHYYSPLIIKEELIANFLNENPSQLQCADCSESASIGRYQNLRRNSDKKSGLRF